MAKIIGQAGSRRRTLAAITGCLLEFAGAASTVVGPARGQKTAQALLHAFVHSDSNFQIKELPAEL